MKKVLMLIMTSILTFGIPAMTVSASSLDDLVNQNQEQEAVTTDTPDQQVEQQVEQPVQQTQQVESSSSGQDVNQNVNQTGTNRQYADEYMNSIKSATDLTEVSPGAVKINEGIKKIASFVIQVLSYFITAFLAVRVLVDLCYICIPFTRSFLANGYQGNPQASGEAGMGGMQGGMGGMGGMGMSGMGGMGMGGMSGGYGMGRGMGMGGMGMGGMGGMNGMGMNGQQGNPAMGRTQWVSTAALNAAAAESLMGQNGKAVSPLKVYAKDMTVVLILTPILLTLAVTGVLTDLGFLLGELIANAVSGIGNML